MITRRRALLLFVIAVFSFLATYFIRSKHRLSAKKLKFKALESYRELIGEVSETVIPTTATPGAKDAKVADYIINVIENCTPDRDRHVILKGLEEIENYSNAKYSTSFSRASSEKKVAVLQHFEKEWNLPSPLLNKIRRKLLGRNFFEQMKGLIVSGYCTSKAGATKGLAYDHIPNEYISCLPYKPHQRSWATK